MNEMQILFGDGRKKNVSFCLPVIARWSRLRRLREEKNEFEVGVGMRGAVHYSHGKIFF
jgi:hypothetical protein